MLSEQEIIESEKMLVTKLTGISDTTHIEFNNEGWTSRVYIVEDGKFVVKFPRNNIAREEYVHEKSILSVVGSIKSGVKLPILRWATDENGYIGYEGIIGKSFNSVAGDLSSEILKPIGTDLGIFLRQLHLLKIPNANRTTIAQEISDFQNKYKKAESLLESSLAPTELSKLNELVFTQLPNKLNEFGLCPKLCHGDLGEYNMILTNSNGIGVIDFGDIGYWDESKDFLGMNSGMLDSALKEYGDGKLLREKIAWRKKALWFVDLPYYMENNDSEAIIKTINNLKQQLTSDSG